MSLTASDRPVTDGRVPPSDAVVPPGYREVVVDPPDGSTRSRSRNSWGMMIAPIAVLAMVVGGWYLLSDVLLEPQRQFLLPSLHDVFIVGFFEEVNRSRIVAALISTARVAFTGLAIAITIGVTVAVLMSQSRWIERSLYPYAVVLQTIPTLALVPLVGFWWGFEFKSRVLVCVIIALFPIITNTLFGLKSADRGLQDLMTLYGASRWTRLWKLSFPAALPSMFVGFRISAGLSVIGAIVGDFFFRQGEPGIGRLLDVYRANLQSEQLYAAVFLSSLLGVAVFLFFGWLSNRVVGKWHESHLNDAP